MIDFRRESSLLTARLVHLYGPQRLEEVLDAVQEAFVAALESWPLHGRPENPRAWLHRVAERRLIDTLRRESRLQPLDNEEIPSPPEGLDDAELEMLFMACHPDLPMESRVALTLRTVGGLGVREIARAFMSTEEAIQRRISRAKPVLAGLELQASIGQRDRLDAVLLALYLIFNEGYKATSGPQLIRPELCDDAISLTERLALRVGQDHPEVYALLGLMYMQASRLPARVDAEGALILLPDQDRSLWDQSRIKKGFAALELAQASEILTHYHVEAGIAACHAWGAPTEEILRWYDLLVEMRPTPAVYLNRAAAVGEVHGPVEGLLALAELQDEPKINRFAFFYAMEARFLERTGDLDEARASLARAIARAESDAESKMLLAWQERLSHVS